MTEFILDEWWRIASFLAPITILGERNVFFANATEAATDKLLCEDAEWLFYSFLDLSHKSIWDLTCHVKNFDCVQSTQIWYLLAPFVYLFE